MADVTGRSLRPIDVTFRRKTRDMSQKNELWAQIIRGPTAHLRTRWEQLEGCIEAEHRDTIIESLLTALPVSQG